MSISYSWKIISIKRVDTSDLQGVVFQIDWKKIGTDASGDTGEFLGTTNFDPKTVDPENFTAFEDLTEERVLGWIEEVVVGDYERQVNARVAEQIENKKIIIHQVSDGKFPWQPTDATITPVFTPSAE
jgi:hypothetical protein